MGQEAAGRLLPARFYDRDTVAVATDLLGKVVRVRRRGGWKSGAIVEDEAYLRDDPANHAYRGPNRRNQSMFKGPGTLYVYSIHSVYCMNLVTQRGEAVLIRALEPLEYISLPTNGPGKVCRALGITKNVHDGLTVGGPAVQIVDGGRRTFEVGTSSRIGVTKAKRLPLRFFITGNPFVSR